MMTSMRPVIQVAPLPLLLGIAVYGIAQTINRTAPAVAQLSWTQADKSDQLHGTAFKEFTLEGKFLVPPRQSSLSAAKLALPA